MGNEYRQYLCHHRSTAHRSTTPGTRMLDRFGCSSVEMFKMMKSWRVESWNVENVVILKSWKLKISDMLKCWRNQATPKRKCILLFNISNFDMSAFQHSSTFNFPLQPIGWTTRWDYVERPPWSCVERPPWGCVERPPWSCVGRPPWDVHHVGVLFIVSFYFLLCVVIACVNVS